MKKLLAFGFVLVLMAPVWAQPLPPAMKPLPPSGKPFSSSTQSLPSWLERQVRSGNLSRQEASDLNEASKKATPAAVKPTENKPAEAQPAKPSEQTPKATTAPSDTTPKKPDEKAKDKTYSGTINAEGFSGLKGSAYLLESNEENRKQLVTLKDTIGRLNREKKPVGAQLEKLESFAKEKALAQSSVTDNQFSLKAAPGGAILVLTAGITGTESLWVKDIAADKPITVSRTGVDGADYWAIRKGTP
jgi:cell wall-associated NlpC family hydrolase